jgi:predicted DNA-binding transcriptional regulator AlpA
VKPTEESQTDSKPSLLMTAKDFRAALGGMSRTTEYRLIKSGALPPAIKIGGKCFRDKAEAVELIAKKRQAADTQQAQVIANQENTETQN